MNKSVGIATGVGIVIIAGVIIFQLSETKWLTSSVDEYYEKGGKVPGVVFPDNPQMLGPLQINKDKYLLGENIFLMVKNLKPMDKGKVLFYTPENIKFSEFTFDGSKTDMFKSYFRPQLLLGLNLCEKDQLVGKWSAVFEGYEESKLRFEIIDEILPNQEYQYRECNIAYEAEIRPPLPSTP